MLIRIPWRRAPLALAGLALLASVAAAQEDDSPQVADAAICLQIEDHQPVAPADTFTVETGRLYCWTRISGGNGAPVVHAWIHEGQTRARVELPIRSDNWRTYSSKGLLPAWTGDWEVKIMTPEGLVLETIPFVVRR